ncbi:MAG TPA: glycosyl hydrolase family 28-related protein [Terriglobales bacterium]|nr:glycosyl hydrolase family 28-related protein [Terriglobales bacterium]
MSGTLLPPAEQQWCDSNGKPLAGGTIYLYVPNTTTYKASWQDVNLTTLNPQPIVLDSSGRAIIWGTGAYRQQVFDQFNNLIYDQVTTDTSGGLLGNMTDNTYLSGTGFTPGTTTQLTLSTGPGSAANMWVFFDAAFQTPDTWSLNVATNVVTFNSPIPVGVQEVNIKVGSTIAVGTPGSGTVTDASVAANAGIQSSKLSYNEGGAGAVTRTVQSRLRDIVSIKDFGAKGDGTTDDTAAIQAAMNSLSSGGELYVPVGTYIVNPSGSSVLTWSMSEPLRVTGAGAGASILQTNSTANASILNATAGTIELSDIGLYGPVTAASAGTLLTTAVDHKFTRVDFCRYFHGFSGTANVGLLDGCHFGTEFINGPISTSSVGAVVNGYAGGINFTNCIAYVPSAPVITPAAGINVISCGACQISNSNIIRQGANVLVNPQSGQTVSSLQISNTYLDSAQTYNLWIAPGTGGSVVRTFLDQVECSSSAQDGININGNNGTVDGVEITALQTNFCAGNGITVVGANAKNIDVNGGEAVGNVGSGISVNSGASVRGKGVFSGSGYGGGGNADGFFCDGSSTIVLKNCTASGNAVNYSVPASAIVQNCDGFVSANTGSSAIPNTGTSVVVSHGLSGTPGAAQIQLTPNVSMGSNPVYVDTTSITATTFTARCASAASGSLNFSWRATCNGQQ